MPNRLNVFILVSLLFSIPADHAYAKRAKVTLEGCSLDSVTFVEPWAGGEFRVRRVGSNHHYLCGDAFEIVSLKGGQDCYGPVGQLVLEGRLKQRSGGNAVTVFAVWNIIKGAPCCWWDGFREPNEVSALREPHFRWLTGNKVPKLKDLSFASIEAHDTYSNKVAQIMFDNSFIAMKCTFR